MMLVTLYALVLMRILTSWVSVLVCRGEMGLRLTGGPGHELCHVN